MLRHPLMRRLRRVAPTGAFDVQGAAPAPDAAMASTPFVSPTPPAHDRQDIDASPASAGAGDPAAPAA
ncbi:hypothetical protein [Burkholderia plantarii]|uniref:hypothetical protein n=1 Tax=Burkholderia plantarii TaxID=41899 RepID=UPI0018DBC150|nr:hypothetical protein [Burkholderia plantarii]MBI0331072.1 hypothetical protein [Burkholderia plantarii]